MKSFGYSHNCHILLRERHRKQLIKYLNSQCKPSFFILCRSKNSRLGREELKPASRGRLVPVRSIKKTAKGFTASLFRHIRWIICPQNSMNEPKNKGQSFLNLLGGKCRKFELRLKPCRKSILVLSLLITNHKQEKCRNKRETVAKKPPYPH